METTATADVAKPDIQQLATDILDTVDKDREREIIRRRFGLEGRRETLEEIGSILGITRERVRQIEKHTLLRLQQMEQDQLQALREHLVNGLEELGRIAPLHEISRHLETDQHAHVNFLAHLVPDITVIPENDFFHHSMFLHAHHDHKTLAQHRDDLLKTVHKLNEPIDLTTLHNHFSAWEAHHLHGLARSVKGLTHLDGKWGLETWSQVNPKSIRDKIFVILQRNQTPMHFNEIAEEIKQSDFKRKNVTTQAIHNELIKDDRFVLVGRGIYALNEWGFSAGTVADVIAGILRQESPLHRDEIIKRVLTQRHVKPTTIILNLQGKDQFKRVAKATYALNE
ncbi:hypothetical protein BRC19_02795 [Candidatus Saccharibacteria bacterium QS_5_54_17]|nr:MAG: hypothetical protein BRC19_02795 [Candidatus Saccharibacteria bacterium QS_5_54_17]